MPRTNEQKAKQMRELRAKDPQKHREMARQWRAANPGYAAMRSRLQRYGLTGHAYEKMLTAQAGLCAICHRKPGMKKGLQIDHDHETGAVRALLCLNCNTGLGNFRDDSKLLRAAVEYLIAHGR